MNDELKCVHDEGNIPAYNEVLGSRPCGVQVEQCGPRDVRAQPFGISS